MVGVCGRRHVARRRGVDHKPNATESSGKAEAGVSSRLIGNPTESNIGSMDR